MATMKAIVIKKHGNIEKDSLVVVDVPKPTPEPRDLLVKIKAVSVNPVDTKIRKNKSDPTATPKENHIIGYDASGIVEAVGPETKLFKVGDEVYFAGNVRKNGTNAEYTVVDERIVGRKPKNFSWEQAAAIPLTGITAWEGLVEQLGLEPNKDYSHKTLLVVAGAGGVGSLIIPLAKLLFKLKVIATASRPETIEYVKSLGADVVIDHSQPSLIDQLKPLGYPDGVDYVFDCAETSQNFDQVLPAVGYFGKIVFITGGPDSKPENIIQAFLKRITLTYEFMFARAITGIEIEKQHELLQKLTELTEQGHIPDRALKIFPSLTKDLAEAHKLLESGRTIGKVVLTADF